MVISREVIVSSIMEAKQTRIVKVEEVNKVIDVLRKEFEKKKIDVNIIWGELNTFKIIDGHYILNNNTDTITQIKKSLYTYSRFEDFKILDMVYDQSFILKALESREIKKKTTNEEYIEQQKKYIKFLKKLAKENPELAKEYAIESLKASGILNEEGNLKAPYNGTKLNDTDFTRGPKARQRKQKQDQ